MVLGFAFHPLYLLILLPFSQKITAICITLAFILTSSAQPLSPQSLILFQESSGIERAHSAPLLEGDPGVRTGGEEGGGGGRNHKCL